MGSDILSQPTNVSTRRVTWVSRRKTGRIFVYDIAHCLKGGVHIGVERDGYVGVSEQPCESGCVAAEADAVGRKGVAQGVEVDILHTGGAQRRLELPLKPAWFHGRVRAGEDVAAVVTAQLVQPVPERGGDGYRARRAGALGRPEHKGSLAGTILHREALQRSPYI